MTERDPGWWVMVITFGFVGVVIVIFGLVVMQSGGRAQAITGGIIVGIGVLDLLAMAVASKYWNRIGPRNSPPE